MGEGKQDGSRMIAACESTLMHAASTRKRAYHFLPMSLNASKHLSISCVLCRAEICTLMRASPVGRGKGGRGTEDIRLPTHPTRKSFKYVVLVI